MICPFCDQPYILTSIVVWDKVVSERFIHGAVRVENKKNIYSIDSFCFEKDTQHAIEEISIRDKLQNDIDSSVKKCLTGKNEMLLPEIHSFVKEKNIVVSLKRLRERLKAISGIKMELKSILTKDKPRGGMQMVYSLL